MRLDYRIDRGLGWLTLSEPPRNLLDAPDFEDPAVLASFLSDPGISAVVVNTSGRHFSAGADPEGIARMLADPDRFREPIARGVAILDAISFSTVPVLAAIRGSCLGAGLEIALACHFRWASANALLGLPESGLGIMPGLGGVRRMVEAAGRRAAVDLVVSGRMIGAEEALALGVVDRVVPTPSLEEQAEQYLRSLVSGRPAWLVRAIMASIHDARRLPRDEALARETEAFLEVARRTSGGEAE